MVTIGYKPCRFVLFGLLGLPELLDVIVGSLLGMEYVDDHVLIVDQYPSVTGSSLYMIGIKIILLLKDIFDLIGKGLDLCRGITAYNDEIVSQRCLPGYIQHFDIDTLLGIEDSNDLVR